jgi:hypothetical protein
VRLSISSFEFDSAGRRAPHKPWVKIGAVVLAALVVVSAALELGWRELGVRPGLANTSSLWALEVDRLKEAAPGSGVVLIGSSRVQSGLDPEVLEGALGGEQVYNLSMSGYGSYGALVFLAEQTDFSGTLIVELWPSRMFWRELSDETPSFIKFYEERPHSDGLETRLDVWLGSRLVLLHPELTMIPVLSRLVASRFKDVPLPIETLNARRYGSLDVRAANRERAPANGTPMSPGELDELVRRYGAPIKRLQARGATVIAYNPPLTGASRAQEEALLPRARYWDVVVPQLGVVPVHYADHEVLESLDCYDGVHLGSREVAIASAYMAELLRARR